MRKYKFDQLWLDAIALTDTNPAEAERAVRDYIETGAEPDFSLLTPSFQAIWVLIRSQIDQRKERNARARLRRIARREGAATLSANSSVNTESAVSTETPVSAECPVSTTPQPIKQTVVIAPGPSQRAQRRRSATKSSASRFASRFRGPIKLSQTTIE